MVPDRPPLFLLEHRPDRPTGADLARMHRSLVHAIRRLARAGAPVRFVGAVFVPDDSRCLYVLQAAPPGHVVEAADIAGVSVQRVSRIVQLTDAAMEDT